MKFIGENLLPNETILHTGTVAWISQFWLLFFGVLSAPIAVGLIFLGMAWLNRHTTEIAVTNLRVIGKYGWISRDIHECRIESIEGVKLEQGIFQRIFGFGDVIVTGVGGHVVPCLNILQPLAFRNAVQKAKLKP
jgi:uncharacterized membrane protein YdbT with pleckstrin-like domain